MNELRLKQLKKTWTQIQAKRDRRKQARLEWQKLGKEVRILGQEITHLLDRYNEEMV